MVAAIHNLISEEEYLQTRYRPDSDFIDGLVLERNWGQFPHARLQILLAVLLANNEKQWNILALLEQRLRVRKGKYRIPDVMALAPDYDRSRPVVEIAPLPCIEILSPEDTMPRILDRCWDYYDLGVPETWILIRLKEKSLSHQTGASCSLQTTSCTAEKLKCPAAPYLPSSVRHECYLFL